MRERRSPRADEPVEHGCAEVSIAGDAVTATCLCGFATGQHPTQQDALDELDAHIEASS